MLAHDAPGRTACACHKTQACERRRVQALSRCQPSKTRLGQKSIKRKVQEDSLSQQQASHIGGLCTVSQVKGMLDTHLRLHIFGIRAMAVTSITGVDSTTCATEPANVGLRMMMQGTSRCQAYEHLSVMDRLLPFRYCRNGLPMPHEQYGFAIRPSKRPQSAHHRDAAQVYYSQDPRS